MMTRSDHLLSAVTLIMAVLLGILFWRDARQQHTPFPVAKSKSFSIAILTGATCATVDEIVQSYRESLARIPDVNWRITEYSAKSDPTLLSAMAHEILLKDYDLVYAIGTSTTKTMIVQTKKRMRYPPIIFSNCFANAWHEWVAEDPSIKQVVTGSTGSYNWPQRIDMLSLLFPNTKRVLVPYPSRKPEGVDTIKELKELLKQKNIEIVPLALENRSDLIPRLKAHLPHVDLMLLTREIVYFDAADLFVSLSKRYHVPIYASDTDSVYKGATAGFGVNETVAGIIAAEQTRTVLLEGAQIMSSPVLDLDQRSSIVMLNREAIKTTKSIDRRFLFLAAGGAIMYNEKEVI